MNKKEFQTEIQKLFSIDINNKFFLQVEIYKLFLTEKNKELNLTRLDNEDLIYGEYFFNSLSPYYELKNTAKFSLLDIGSGSGIPGLLIAMMFPESEITLIESSSKKCNFLNELIKKIGLGNVDVINQRIEIFSKFNNNRFDFVTCRAFASLKIILEVGLPCLKVNGVLMAPKSKNYETEIEESAWIIEQLKVEAITPKKTNSASYEIITLEIVKTHPTDKSFPREWKEIVK